MNNTFVRVLAFFCFAILVSTAVSAQSVAGKGFVNARELAESMGLNYRWFPMQKALVLSKDGKTMRLEIDQTEGQVGNTVVTLPAAPRLEDGEVMIPARSVVQVFGAASATPVRPVSRPPEPETDPEPDTDPETETSQPVAPPRVVVPPPAQPAPPAVMQEEEEEEEEVSGTKLVSVRHSLREDHTRVVLEFDGNVTHRLEKVSDNKFKLRIDGCLNIIPTKRSNPVGRDVKAISFNSGANRQGLVVSIDVPEGGAIPTVETVGNPFRMVVSVRGGAVTLASPTQLLAATPTVALKPQEPVKPASETVKTPPIAVPEKPASATIKVEKPAEKPPVIEVPVLNASAPSKPVAEEVFEVPLASLSRPVFAGRTIIIDPAHGGRENGVTVPELPSEKQITLNIALKLRQMLKKVGLNAIVLRTQDSDLSQAERQALTNRSAGDLLVSLHCGGSTDDLIEGIACFAYDPGGVSFDADAVGKLSPLMVFQEWTQSYRFDLAKFLAGKVRGRLVEQLRMKDRGVRSLPLSPLRFVTMPAVLVEVGMLTHPTEGRRLSGTNFPEAAAKAITNGVLDFFNSIRLNN
ncbi:MAG TPA: N-acetylmuramoyl-L-alanine amidase [Candidatus Ozemobacteraceae bacterium]|nr:N-acetylmuramoyl-L-alanine amidase [Candidatus Ozemobacteraceae bacterium]